MTTAMPTLGGAPYRTGPDRFDAIEAHASYPQAIASPPRVGVAGEIAGPLAGIAMVVVLLAAGSSARSSTGHIVVAVLLLALSGTMLVRALVFLFAPLERTAAVVVDKRVRISGGSEKSGRLIRSFATLALRDGSYRELTTTAGLADEISLGDGGIAYTKGERLIGFHRIAV